MNLLSDTHSIGLLSYRDKIETGVSCGLLFYLQDLLFSVTGVGNFASSFFKEARKKKQVISHSIVNGESSYSNLDKTKTGFIKSGVSFISNSTCSTTAATNLEGYLPLIKSLHKISCLTPFMYEQCPTPIQIAIDACNPVDEIQMCMIDCPLTSLGRPLRQALLKEATYKQVQNLGVPKTPRVLTLAAAPSMSCAMKLSVKSNGCGINVWFMVTVHLGSIPQLFAPKQEKKRKLQESAKDRVQKCARTAVEDNAPHEIGQNELFDQYTCGWY